MFELKEASDQLMFLRQFRLVFLLKAARDLNLGNLIGKEFTPVKTIARSEGLCPDKLNRLVNALASFGFFEVVDQGVRHSQVSETLKSDSDSTLLSVIDFATDPAVISAWEFLAEGIKKPDVSSFELANKIPALDYFSDEPSRLSVFQNAMQESMAVCKPAISEIKINPGDQVTDCGGGDGSLIRLLLDRHPDIQGQILEVPSVVQAYADSMVDHKNIRWIATDLQTSELSGSDVFIFNRIFHEWNLSDCQSLLERAKKALNPGGRIYIIDFFQQDHDSPQRKRLQGIKDIEMMVMSGQGEERKLSELKAITADAGLHMNACNPWDDVHSVAEFVAL